MAELLAGEKLMKRRPSAATRPKEEAQRARKESTAASITGYWGTRAAVAQFGRMLPEMLGASLTFGWEGGWGVDGDGAGVGDEGGDGSGAGGVRGSPLVRESIHEWASSTRFFLSGSACKSLLVSAMAAFSSVFILVPAATAAGLARAVDW